MDTEKIGSTLKSLRKAKRLSLKEMAEILGVTPAAVCMYEAGTRVPSDAIKKKYSEWSKKSVTSIFFA